MGHPGVARWLAAVVWVVGAALAGCGEGSGGAGAPTAAGAAVSGAVTKSAPVPLVVEKAGAGSAPVFRFAKISNGAYFFTGNVGEKDQILTSFPDFRCEGLAFFRTSDGSGVPVYRFANLGNGGYFYTANSAERDFVQATRPDMRYEGSTFSVATADTPGSQPVYRLANLSNGAYLFTANAQERAFAISLGNWRDEGIAFYGAPVDDALAAVNWCAPPGTLPTVTRISVDRLMYLAPATFTVTGTGLDQSIRFDSGHCSNITEQAGGTATQRVYTCSPSGVGLVNFTVWARDGSAVWSGDAEVGQPRVRLSTSKGDIVVELNPAKSPITVANYLQYVRDGYYAGLVFHRVINDFMIQGGGFDLSLQLRQTRAPIQLESQNGLSNVRGTIAMARTNIANSATSQFFINVVDNLFLNYTSTASPGYAVFGQVVQGMDVVDQIKVVPTGVVSGMADVPLTPVVINSATQIQ